MLLSSVREMAAFGGKSVKGVVKDRKDPKGVVRWGLRGVAGWDERRRETTERQKRKREAARKRTRIAILGGRISISKKAPGRMVAEVEKKDKGSKGESERGDKREVSGGGSRVIACWLCCYKAPTTAGLEPVDKTARGRCCSLAGQGRSGVTHSQRSMNTTVRRKAGQKMGLYTMQRAEESQGSRGLQVCWQVKGQETDGGDAI